MKIIAEFDKLSRDLFWSIYTPDGELIRWSGYDDNYWWYNVAHTEKFTDRKDNKGNIWRLDANTDEVSLINN